jgi:hypothetical protein
MVTVQTRLRLNVDKVVASLIDGEPIMINLSSGVYYSMDGVGGFIWERIAAAHSVEEIAAALTESFEVSLEQARNDVINLAAQLLAEDVVVASENGAAAADACVAAPAERLPYAPPNLDIYRDIGHLCALDPPMPGLKDLRWKEPGGESST